jgi:hypothetical protein
MAVLVGGEAEFVDQVAGGEAGVRVTALFHEVDEGVGDGGPAAAGEFVKLAEQFGEWIV